MSTLKHAVSLNKAKQLTSHYEKNKAKILKDEFHGKATLPTSETFDRAAFDAILAKEGCVKIRIYYGMDEDLQVKLVVVGVDENDQDISTSNANKKSKNQDIKDEPVFAFSDSTRCPPNCPPPPPPPPDEG
jgi:hypothetical protein